MCKIFSQKSGLILFLFLFLFIGVEEKQLFAQQTTDTLVLDSLPILPSTLLIKDANGNLLSANDYKLIPGTGKIILLNPNILKPIEASFETLPFSLNIETALKDTSLIQETPLPNEGAYTIKSGEKEPYTPFEGLQKNGSISRGISVGNGQSPVLSSNLNLQLSGDLNTKTKIRASITDNNIPVQPDGTTQNLREFDQVFMEIENEDFGKLSAGDYLIKGPSGRFLSFSKKISGAGIETGFNTRNGRVSLYGHGALARGKFTRNVFFGREGDQGPYKLTGANQELFLIIISGTERVYLNGVLQIRGLDQDYIIDYNTGEITFTTLNPITRDTRIIVEFQYTEQNYLRTLGFAGAGYQSSKWDLKFGIYNEADQKTQPLRGDFSTEEQNALLNAGNNPEDATLPGWTPSPYNPNRILYEIVDSLGIDTVFVFSTDSNKTLFNVLFSFVGANKGNYIIQESAGVNGRVYRFVPPIGGIPQGDYEPIQIVPTPKSLTVGQFSVAFSPNKNVKVGGEIGVSQEDLNTFVDGKNYGTAGRWFADLSQTNKDWTFSQSLGIDWIESSFRSVERVRSVEFNRDWNLNPNTVWQEEDQILGNLDLGVKKKNHNLKLRSEWLKLGDTYNGIRESLSGHLNSKYLAGTFTASYLNGKDTSGVSSFFRHNAKVSLHYGKPYVGLKTFGEWNNRPQGNPFGKSYSFFENEFFTGYGDTSGTHTEIFGFRRTDDSVYTDILQQAAQSIGGGIRGNTKEGFLGKWVYQLKFRRFDFDNPAGNGVERNSTTGRIQYQQRFFRNSLNLSVFYDVSLSNEPRREVRYIEVAPGLGTYTWKDYNQNGIQELDEFEQALFPDEATFVRTFILTNRFEEVSYTNFAPSLNLSFRNMRRAPKWLKPITIQSYFSQSQKGLLQNNQNTVNPFYEYDRDSALISFNQSFRNTVFYRRGNPKFNTDYTFLRNAVQNLASFGLESNQTTSHILNLRGLVNNLFPVETVVNGSESRNTSQGSTIRDFRIVSLSVLPSFGYQPSPLFKATLSGEIQYQENQIASLESLEKYAVGFELKYNNSKWASLLGRLSLINNQFKGNQNSPAGYQMLNGLQPGLNGVWEISAEKNVNQFIRLSLVYQGRQSQDNLAIHTGSLQIKAFF